MFGKSKKGPMSYRDLEKKYNSLELDYELLIEKTSSELYKAIIDGDFTLKYENDSLKKEERESIVRDIDDVILGDRPKNLISK